MASAAWRFLAGASLSLLIDGCAASAADGSAREVPRRPAAEAPTGGSTPVRRLPPAPPRIPADYTNLVDAAKRLGLTSTWGEPGRELTLAGKNDNARFLAGSREVSVNGLRLFLGNPILASGGQLFMSKLDVERTLTPLLKLSAVPKLPARPKIIAIDPGHGGGDDGMENKALGLKEKVLTLEVSFRLKKLLEARGFQVVMTRTEDRVFSAEKKIDLPMRAQLANRARADLFISIHFNSLYPNIKVGGTEVYIQTRPGQRSDSSFGPDQPDDTELEAMAVNRFDAWSMVFAHAMHREVIGALKTQDRGLKTKHLLVLKDLNCPAVLIEAVFLSNDVEAKRAATPAYRQQIAEALANGIDGYVAALESVRPKSKD